MFFQNAASYRDTSGNRRRRESCREGERSLFYSEKFEGAIAELCQLEDRWGGQLLELIVGVGGDFEEIHQIPQAISRVGIRRLRFAGLLQAIAQHPEGRLNFPFLALARDDPEHGEDIFDR